MRIELGRGIWCGFTPGRKPSLVDIQLNTLYVFTAGSYLRRDHRTVVVEVEKKARLSLPIHHLDAIAAFGQVMVSPGLIELCVESGVALTYLSESGRLI